MVSNGEVQMIPLSGNERMTNDEIPKEWTLSPFGISDFFRHSFPLWDHSGY